MCEDCSLIRAAKEGAKYKLRYATEPASEYTYFYGKGNESRELGAGLLCIRESFEQLAGLTAIDMMSYIICT
jgi:hypothetical protein